MRILHVSIRVALVWAAAAVVCLLGGACADAPGPGAAGEAPRPRASASPAASAAAGEDADAAPAPTAKSGGDSAAAQTPHGATTTPPHGSGDDSPPDFEGTAGVSERKRGTARPALLRGVRAAGREGFDRVVFEFEGTAAPGYHVEYVDRPVRQCGSGEVVPLAGDGWLEVRLTPADAHTEAGAPTVTDRARRPGLRNLKELKLTCDFEAEVVWVLGLAAPNRYRVLELSNPTRLVVDVRHR